MYSRMTKATLLPHSTKLCIGYKFIKSHILSLLKALHKHAQNEITLT